MLCFLPSIVQAETFHYKISKMGIGVKGVLKNTGETQYKGKKYFLIEFKADGFNFNDEEKIYLDPKTFKPVYVERDVNVFGKKEKISEDYTQEGQIKITKTTGDGKTEEQILKKQGDIDNIYGFIYRYRKQGSFKIGDVIDVKLPTKDFKIKLTKHARLSYYAKTYDCFYMESEPKEYKIWFDASEKKLPLRIIGGGTMIMTGYEE
jgi:hypothetical protein